MILKETHPYVEQNCHFRASKVAWDRNPCNSQPSASALNARLQSSSKVVPRLMTRPLKTEPKWRHKTWAFMKLEGIKPHSARQLNLKATEMGRQAL